MSTTITPGTAVIKHTMTLTLGGKNFDVEFTKTINSVLAADKRIVRVPTSQIDLVTLTAAAVGKGQFQSFNHFVIMNRDDTNFVRFRISESGGDTSDQKLNPGEWMVLWNSELEVNITEAAFTAFVTWDTVSVQADTAEVDLEIVALAI